MSSRLHVAVVGLGFGERVLVPAFRTDERCEVVGLCSNHYERAQEAATRLKVGRAYRHWQEAIEDPAVNAVAVATPPALHADVAEAALRSGRHVFCEKPLTATLESAQRLRDLASASKLANVIDFEFPEIPEWIRAKQIVDAGALGRIQSVVVTWHTETYANRTGQETWKRRWADGGGALNDMACHALYYLEWLLGPIRSIWAAPLCGDPFDTMVVMGAELSGGTPVSISVGTAAFLGEGHSVRVYGESGTLALRNPTADIARGFELAMGSRLTGRLEPLDVEPWESSIQDGRIAAVSRLVRRFATWAIEGQPTVPDFRDGCRVQALVEMAWQSRREGLHAAPSARA
jgi:predicted dehydrogenase